MKTYKAVFHAESVLNGIPSAQTLFGAFCSLIKQKDGQLALDSYLDSFQNGIPWFVHSDLLPADLFPMPKRDIFPLEQINADVSSRDPKEKLEVLASYKKYKKLKYVSEGIAKDYILSGKFKQLQTDLITHEDWFVQNGIWIQKAEEDIDYEIESQLLTRNGRRGNTIEKDLFYSNALYCGSKQKFCLYLKSSLPKEKIQSYLNLLQYVGVGSKRTVGMNVLVLDSLEEIQFRSKQPYLLSACAPREAINYKESFYQIQSNLYRGSYCYNGGYMTGRFSLLSAGSLLSCQEKKAYFGQLLPVLSQGKMIYHYGMGFVL